MCSVDISMYVFDATDSKSAAANNDNSTMSDPVGVARLCIQTLFLDKFVQSSLFWYLLIKKASAFNVEMWRPHLEARKEHVFLRDLQLVGDNCCMWGTDGSTSPQVTSI